MALHANRQTLGAALSEHILPWRGAADIWPAAVKKVHDLLQGYSRAVLLMGGLALFFMLSLVLFLASLSSEPVVAETVPSQQAASAALPGAPLQEVHIASNGLVLLRNAQVVGIQGTILTVSNAWEATDFTWTVTTNASNFETRSFGTSFLNREGRQLALRDFKVGDLVTVTGMLDASAAGLALRADVVRKKD